MITSTSNRHVVETAKLRKRAIREDRKLFLVEGAQAVGEAVDAGVVEALYHTSEEADHSSVRAARRAAVKVEAVSEAVMAHLTSTVTPQGLVAVARFVHVPLEELPASPSLVPVLCAVRDPGNAGTVLRSADAVGADGVVFAGTSVDVYNPKTVRASAGSLFHVPVVKEEEIRRAVDLLRNRGCQVLGADARATRTIYEVDMASPTALVFGNEAWGLPVEVRAAADDLVRIPIAGAAESLNLAAAAAVALFEAARRQRRAAGSSGHALGAAISASAHDLRSSLTAIKGFATTLAAMWDRLEDSSRKTMVEGLSVDAERMAATMKMLIDAARIEEGAFSPSPERHDLGEDAAWVSQVFSRSDDYPEVRTSGSLEAAVDADRVQAMLLALVEQAIWWGDSGPVEVEVGRRDGGAMVQIRREGECDPHEVEAALASPGAGGEGRISLWLVQRLAEAQGMRLEWEAGSSICFRLGGLASAP